VINVITRKGPDLHGPEVSLSTSSFGTYQGRASYGSQYKGTEFLLSATFDSSDGPTLFFPEFASPATNSGVTSGTDYDRNQYALVTISRGGFTLQGLYGYSDKGVPTGYFGAVFNDPRTLNREGNQFVNLNYQHSFGAKWQLAAQTSYNRVTLDGPVATTASGPPDDYSFHGQWWDSELTLTRSLFGKHKLTRFRGHRQFSPGSIERRSRRQPPGRVRSIPFDNLGALRPGRIRAHPETFIERRRSL
jgi:outer membrane receptor for ferrienterochelin and colicins